MKCPTTRNLPCAEITLAGQSGAYSIKSYKDWFTNICNLHRLQTCNFLPIFSGRAILYYHFESVVVNCYERY
jgi:hypothetical protein